MELCLQNLTSTEKENFCDELKLTIGTFDAWSTAYLNQCTMNRNFEPSFLQIMNISSNTPRDIKLQLFCKYNTLKKHKQMVNDLMAEKTSMSKRDRFEERTGFSQKQQEILQRFLSDYNVERETVSDCNIELRAEIEKLRAKIEENERVLKEKWPLAYEYKGLSKRIKDENEEIWYKQWDKMASDTKCAYTNYEAFRGEMAERLLSAARREFMDREDVKSTLDKYY